jgi:flagellar biosynthesis/type III secretory pathway chaperone
MTAAVTDLADLTNDLLAVLDEEIGLETAAAAHLGGLSEAVIARDRGLIDTLSDRAMETHALFEVAEVRRTAAMAALAAALGCSRGHVTLRRLVRELPGEEGRALDDRRRRIESLVNQVRRQHLHTAVLLHECARVNHELLVQLFPQMDSTNVYGSNRTVKRPGGSLVDARG